MKKTIEEIKGIIESKAAEYGFKTEPEFIKLFPNIRGKAAGITVIDNTSASIEYGTVSVSAFIATMGGHPTPDELLQAADEIVRAANLAKEIEGMELTFPIE